MVLTEKSSTEMDCAGFANAGAVVVDFADLEVLITRLLKNNIGDFTNYKRASFKRRVEQRLKQLCIPTLAEYIRLLDADPSEYTNLRSVLTVKVSEFFRDPQNFTTLAFLLKNDTSFSENGLRAWCCGCATGEEAYSLAILLCEHLGVTGCAKSRIFATDVDPVALESARRGEYRVECISNVTSTYKERYFTCEGANTKVRDCLRRLVLFGKLDIVTEDVFSKIDILFCRNLFIYFNKKLQAEVFSKFHYALAPGGLLLLGKAEVIPAAFTSFYTRIERTAGLYRKRRQSK